MNYIFISPAYPVTCTSFCERLNEAGVTVLGIGDVQYDALNERLKNALTEYYYVETLEDYDQVYRAAAYFIHRYGRIDWLESLNEYWLAADARLRTDFNIAVGTREDRIGDMIRKSGMKRIFLEAGIPTARQHIVTNVKEGKAFAIISMPPLILSTQGLTIFQASWKGLVIAFATPDKAPLIADTTPVNGEVILEITVCT